MTQKILKLTQDQVCQYLRYDPLTGQFTWLRNTGTAKAESRAGSVHYKGHIVIQIDRVGYPAHQLAWLLYYNKWARMLIHKNGDRTDNRISNLRERYPRPSDPDGAEAPNRPYKPSVQFLGMTVFL